MVDLHCHILPGLDDGAASEEAAVEMARLAAGSGTTDIVATPHSNPQYRFEPATVEAVLAQLQQRIDGVVRLHYGCEMHFMPENVERAIREPWHHTLGHRGCVLVEFSDHFVPRNSARILRRLHDAGARPVIAHPERNPILRERFAAIGGWVDEGCLVQVTAQSLLGQFGKSAEESAWSLVSEGLAHCVASDGHDPLHRPPVLQEARRRVEDECGEETAHSLFEKNPRAILLGEAIAHGRAAKARRAWFSLW